MNHNLFIFNCTFFLFQLPRFAYNPAEIEPRLYEKWVANKYFHAEVDRSKKPFTIVMPPPNITGSGTLSSFGG